MTDTVFTNRNLALPEPFQRGYMRRKFYFVFER
jgi:hypothetical protein